MNTVNLIGRLTKDPDVRYASASQMAIARFSIAINRGKDKNGNDLGADYPNIVCYGKLAEQVERFCRKGMQVAVEGRIRTGSYEKNGQKIFTTEVAADRVDFLDKGSAGGAQKEEPGKDDLPLPEGFSLDDIPF
jgi:single-strand DNA-binding protein